MEGDKRKVDDELQDLYLDILRQVLPRHARLQRLHPNGQ